MRSRELASLCASVAFLVLVVAAHLPLTAMHFRQLWKSHPHYEFFPMVLVAIGALLVSRWPGRAELESPALRLASGTSLACGLALLASGVLFYSPWLAAAAVFLSGLGLLLRLTGPGWRKILPIWLLFLLVIPPPRNFDSALVQGMQRITSSVTSSLLDLAGVLHLRLGNVIRLPDRELFVAEACSGVHSQLVLLACAAIWCVLARRVWLASLILIASALFWAVAANVLRVFTIVYVASRYGLDLSSGWPHELIGYGLVAIGFLLLIATDQLLQAAFAPIEVEGRPSLNPLARVWNRLFAGGTSKYHRRGFAGGRRSSRKSQLLATAEGTRWWSPAAGLAASLGFLLLFLLQTPILLGAIRQAQDDSLRPARRELQRSAETLPAVLGAWQQIGFEHQTRDVRSDLGEHSDVWLYSNGIQQLQVSFDYPFRNWHELTHCYEARGWQVLQRVVQGIEPASKEDPYLMVEFTKPTGEHAYLWFSLFDRRGTTVWKESSWHFLASKMLENPLLKFPSPDRFGRWLPQWELVQAQQFLVAQLPLHEDEVRELTEQFLYVRDKLKSDASPPDGTPVPFYPSSGPSGKV